MSSSQSRPADQQRRVQELQVLQSEMKSLKKGAKVYKQQPNSNLFFKADKVEVFNQAKRKLDGLIGEYKQAEQPHGDKELTEEGDGKR